MRKEVAYILLMLAALSVSAQSRQLTLSKGDYRMDGYLIVTNESLLQRLRAERFDTIWLETPHNGLKLLKPHSIFWSN